KQPALGVDAQLAGDESDRGSTRRHRTAGIGAILCTGESACTPNARTLRALPRVRNRRQLPRCASLSGKSRGAAVALLLASARIENGRLSAQSCANSFEHAEHG